MHVRGGLLYVGRAVKGVLKVDDGLPANQPSCPLLPAHKDQVQVATWLPQLLLLVL